LDRFTQTGVLVSTRRPGELSVTVLRREIEARR
jgi:hypothetical protein